MPSPKLEPLVLSTDERQVLEGWARRRKTLQAPALRSRIVLASADGASVTAVAADLGVSWDTGRTRAWAGHPRAHLVDGRRDGHVPVGDLANLAGVLPQAPPPGDLEVWMNLVERWFVELTNRKLRCPRIAASPNSKPTSESGSTPRTRIRSRSCEPTLPMRSSTPRRLPTNQRLRTQGQFLHWANDRPGRTVLAREASRRASRAS
jgi:hypothetical protein